MNNNDYGLLTKREAKTSPTWIQYLIAKRTITKNKMQMIISPTRLTRHQGVLRELERI